MSCTPNAERQARYLNALEGRMRVLERETALIKQIGDCSNSIVVWSKELFRVNETVVGGKLEEWIGTMPLDFEAKYIRLSTQSNPGKTLFLNIFAGLDVLTLATLEWTYVENQDSILIPYAEWGSALPTNIIPAGARISYSNELTGSGDMTGLSVDFIGRWKV